MYQADETRYDKMQYHRCGNSGLKLPEVSLGMWHNFGSNADYDNMKNMCMTAFDAGITHFDLANNYGPVYGAAEENFGRILKDVMKPYRDELVISTKAGFDMWPGPYGDWGSKKYLVASLDQSLKLDGSGICGYFLSSQTRSRNSVRGNHACIRWHRKKRKSIICRNIEL